MYFKYGSSCNSCKPAQESPLGVSPSGVPSPTLSSPTFTEFCSLKDSSGIFNDQSCVHLLKNSSYIWSKLAACRVARGSKGNPLVTGYSIRTRHYRFTSWQGKRTGDMTYSHQNDPVELNRLASGPNMHRLKSTLTTHLHTITAARGRSENRRCLLDL